MCKTIKQKVKLRTNPEHVYDLLINSKLHSALTGQKANISPKIGGLFSIHNGNTTGINVDLVPGKRIVQAWRTKKFPEGIFSMATIQLTRSKDGGTELVLTHRGVPKDLIPATENDWRAIYWEKMRSI